MEDNALPVVGEQPAAASGEAVKDAPDLTAQPAAEGEQTPPAEDKPKPEKTPEQREIDRLRRGIDRRTRQLAEARARLEMGSGLQREQQQAHNDGAADDSQPLSLTRAQIRELVTAEAAKLAPTLNEQAAEAQRRQGVIESLAKTWGKDKFDEVASDLDEAFDGLADRSGRPKPATEAVFEADEPAKVIEYLSSPEHADEAERISRMSAVQAGKAIARLEDRIKADEAKAKPQASKAPAPLEPIQGKGGASEAPDPVKNEKAWRAWRNEQERKGLL